MEQTPTQLIAQAIESRTKSFVAIQIRLSPAMRQLITQKLQAEAHAAIILQSADQASATQRAQYSFVLDPQFFEQKFLN